MQTIFQYSDMVFTIAKQLDYLSRIDRIAFDNMLSLMPEIQDLNAGDDQDMRLQVFNDWARYTGNLYNSKVLEGLASDRLGFQYRYELNVIWDKNLPEPTIDLVKLSMKLSIGDDKDDFQSILSHGLIWSLQHPAGKFFRNNKLTSRIICDDRDTYIYQDMNQSNIVNEHWFRKGKKHRDNLPAFISFDNLGKNWNKQYWNNGTQYFPGIDTYTMQTPATILS